MLPMVINTEDFKLHVPDFKDILFSTIILLCTVSSSCKVKVSMALVGSGPLLDPGSANLS